MKQPSSYNSSSEDFALDRAIAEAEALELLKERNLNFKKLKEQADKRAYAKAEAEAKRAEVEAKKAEAEAKKAETLLKEKQMEAERQAEKSSSRKRIIIGSISALFIIVAFLWTSSSVKGCHETDESDLYSAEIEAEGNYDDYEEIVSEDEIFSAKTELKKSYYVDQRDHYFEIYKNGKYGIADLKGNVIVEPIYDYISYNEETNLIEVMKDDKYGLFNPKKKKEVASCIYDEISYYDSRYFVKSSGKSGILNPDGSVEEPLK